MKPWSTKKETEVSFSVGNQPPIKHT